MLGNPGFYANKKRKKPVLKQKKVSEGNDVVKSNPSKRHRDRLNGELDRLTDLLPFSGDVRSRLDKLSVLRLSVGYLRVKSYFRATVNNNGSSLMFSGGNGQNGNNVDIAGFSEGDLLLQALNGFVMVVTADGSVFYVSSTIKDYLGFHQSDVVHQSVFELIHTDDRTLFRQHLHFALNPPSTDASDDGLQASSVMYSPEQLPPENSSFLERSFVCRFRCLLDNSSGFLALKFQGRLKYLHGQRSFNGNGNKPQLALFAIAVPVQPPTIVEIRAKMLLFQTKHKLDFTPMGVDSRGKIILGYSEIELCMKGSGYQFIHAADMMYCADNHIRMIKTGESGLSVFRLLSKSAGWVWVKANAKLIYKGGRPDFIIAYQRALANAEGEEYFRQRRLQLPFSSTTGEGVLYDSGPTVDVSQFQFNKMFTNMEDMKKDVTPGSLLDCFMRQDEKAYMPTVDTPLPVDQVFMDSQALVTIGNDAWQEGGAAASTGDPSVMKEEAKQSVMNVIDDLKKMAEDGNFCTALKNLEVCDVELMEWENALKRLNQDEERQSSVRTELDSVLTNDIFDYIDTMLFKEKGEDCLSPSPPSCLTAGNSNQQDPFAQPQLFQTPSPDRTYSPINGVYAHAMNGPMAAGQGFMQSAQTQKLSHHGPLMPQADTNLPPLQQLQLQDIFSPSIELPELTVPDTSAPFQSCGQTSMSHMGHPAQSGQFPQCPLNNLQMTNGQTNSLVPSVMDILPPLVPCKDLNSTNPPNIQIPYATACLQGSTPFETHNHQVQQWPQQQRLQNGHELMPACQGQTAERQTLPNGGLWPRSVAELHPAQQGGLSCGQAATQSSCMFEQHFSSGPAGGNVLALSGSSAFGGADASLDQSPPQGSCYFQWSHSESVVGTAAIEQENASISPPNMSSTDHTLDIQHYLNIHRQTQDDRAMYLTE